MELLTTDEACAVLGVSPTTLGRMVRDGEIPRYKIRASVRFDRADLEKYLQSCRELHRPVIPVKVSRKSRQDSRICGYVPGMKVV